MNWLITGGCGFVGRNLVKYLNTQMDVPLGRIRVYDNESVATRDDLTMVASVDTDDPVWSDASVACGLWLGDIRDADRTHAAFDGADYVVHLAACTGVPISVEDPLFDCTTNVIGTLNCLMASTKTGAKRFVFASSGAPLGEAVPPLTEETLPKPISPYGASKLSGEAYLSAFSHTFGLGAVALRFGNVYGPLSGHKESVVAKFIKRAMDGKPLEIYGDGTSTRDYIFVEDLMRAITQAVANTDATGEVVQIATERETQIQELTDSLVDLLNDRGIEGIDVRFAELRIGDMERNYSDISKAKSLLDWEPAVSLNDGLGRTIDWFLARSMGA